MVQTGEAIFKKTVAEEETPSLLSFIFPSCALVLLFSAFMFFYCRMKCKILFIYLITLLPNIIVLKLKLLGPISY